MNVSCPQCKTVFRVDPRKVPTGGVRARCSVCGGVFEVSSDDDRRGAPVSVGATSPAAGEGAAPQRADSGRAAPAPPRPPRESQPEPPSDAGPAQPPPSPAVGGGSPGAAAPKPPSPPEPEQGSAKPGKPSSTPFGQPDPDARARRLARALISDLAAYNPERQERGLREGKLKELFQEDLKKCWQEYVEQIGMELAKRTPYFRDALNEILAKGSRVF